MRLVVLLYFVCLSLDAQTFDFKQQATEKNISFRGLCVVDAKTVWVSGSQGRVMRTIDAGKTWEDLSPKGFEKYDFRDIHAFDAQNALIINVGSPAYVLRTSDAGKTWATVYQNTSKKAFLDDVAFENEQNGIIFGDPDSTGRFLTLLSYDGGKNWQTKYDFFPTPEGSEAGFAASGSILQYKEGKIWLATGGGTKSRLFYSENAGKTWEIQETPILAGEEAQGIFSLAIGKKNTWVAVGGDYTQAKSPLKTAIYTQSAGVQWQVSSLPPRGYRSGVAHVAGKMFVCVGTSGTDFSTDAGKTWKPLNDLDLHTVRFANGGKVGWAVGTEGRIYIIAP